MIMTVVRAELKPDMVEAARAYYEEKLWPFLQKTEGFKSAINGIDRATNHGIAVNVWESEEAQADVLNSAEFQQLSAGMLNFFKAPPTRENCEITLQFQH